MSVFLTDHSILYIHASSQRKTLYLNYANDFRLANTLVDFQGCTKEKENVL